MPTSHRLCLVPAALFLACTAEPTPEGADTDDPSTDDGSGDGGTPGGEVTPERLAQRGNCPARGAGTDHTAWITADETWTAADSPHRIPTNLRITATVTVEPCAEVLLGEAVVLEIGAADAPGVLVASGEVSTDDDAQVDVRPVHFDRLDAAGNWGQIAVASGSRVELSVVALLHGGNTSFAPGALLLQGPADGTNVGVVERNGTLDRVLVSDSATWGLNLEGYGALTTDSQQIWIEDGGSDEAPFAVHVEPGVAHTLPDDLVIEGNVRDAILVSTVKTHMSDDTFGDHGVPYHVRSALFVAAAEGEPAATLTIEPGVTVAFEHEVGSGLTIGSSETRAGILVAEGTAESPIVFTSATDAPAAGDWQGLFFRYTDYAANRLRHARVEYAGADGGASSFGCGPGDNDAAILLEGQGDDDDGPSEVFVADTVFDHIAGTTVIVSGWTDEAGPDFSDGNTFGADTPGCKVSRPQRSGGGDVCDGGRDMCWE